MHDTLAGSTPAISTNRARVTMRASTFALKKNPLFVDTAFYPIMKTLVLICLLAIFASPSYGQNIRENSVNIPVTAKDQLTKQLKKQKDLKFFSGVIMTGGIVTMITGIRRNMSIPDNQYYRQSGEDARDKNLIIILAGTGITVFGTGIHVVSRNNIRDIQTELVKYQGSAMGIRVRINF